MASVRRRGPAFDNTTLSPFGMVDVGAGYQFNSWFRADATLEYRAGGAPRLAIGSQPQVRANADSYRADVSSFVGLVNGYATPGAWYGFTPFLGAGVGLAENSGSPASAEPPQAADFANGSRTSFAWALMAGVDYDISPNLKLELGYRYLNYGAIAAGGSDCLAGGSGDAMPVAASSSPVRSRRATDWPRTISDWASSIDRRSPAVSRHAVVKTPGDRASDFAGPRLDCLRRRCGLCRRGASRSEPCAPRPAERGESWKAPRPTKKS